jgi:hypothetical protein
LIEQELGIDRTGANGGNGVVAILVALFSLSTLFSPSSNIPINKAQLPSYMKPLDIPHGLIINFNELN